MAKTKNSETGASLSADALAVAAKAATGAAGAKGPPPVHLWNPPFCGDIDMRIARDGTWFYLGTPIGRHALVKLFAGIIRRDGADFFLVTPAEKVGITVDDAPFVAVDFNPVPGGLEFETNVGDRVVAGPDHRLRVARDPVTGAPSPYIGVRRNLEALIDRKSFYRLVELGEVAVVDGIDWFGIWSMSVFFPLIRADALALGEDDA